MASTAISCCSAPRVTPCHHEQRRAKSGDGYRSSFLPIDILSRKAGFTLSTASSSSSASSKPSNVRSGRSNNFTALLQQHTPEISSSSNGNGKAIPQSPSTNGAAAASPSGPSTNICWQKEAVTKQQRRDLLGQKGCIVWFTGLSGSGKTTVAFNVDKKLTGNGKLCYVLDGDNLRHGLCKNLGFSAADRQENIRRVGEAARLFAEAGFIVLVSLISPYRRDRDLVRSLVPGDEFVEVFMDVSLETCENRDCKGLYKLARSGVIKGFTGIDDPYERPLSPEISLKDVGEHGARICPDEMAAKIIGYLSENGYLRS